MDLVVQPRAGQELVGKPPDGARLGVAQSQLQITDLSCFHSQLCCQKGEKGWTVARIDPFLCFVQRLLDHGQDRLQVCLLVWCKLAPLFSTLQVNAEIGNSQYSSRQVDKPSLKTPCLWRDTGHYLQQKLMHGRHLIVEDNAAGQSEIPVKPGVPKPPAVTLNCHLIFFLLRIASSRF